MFSVSTYVVSVNTLFFRKHGPWAQAQGPWPKARAWDAGADGIYVFNCFNPRDPIFRELGDPKLLDKLDKKYDVNVGPLDRWLKDGDQFVWHYSIFEFRVAASSTFPPL